MLDKHILPVIRPAVEGLARALVRMGMKADQVTVLAFAMGLVAMICIAFGAYLIGALAILLSRLCDALDGAVAQQTQSTDAGGFLDITLDFLFYGGIVLAFAWSNPSANALAAATLMAAFIGTGSSFLAFATLAAKRGLVSTEYPNKSFYFLSGLTEATETIAFFIAFCIWPEHFAVLAYVFAALCLMTICSRVIGGYLMLKHER